MPVREPHFSKSKKKGTFREVVKDMGDFANDKQSQESGRQLLKGRYTELYGNERMENELCPRNPRFLVVTNKISDNVHKEVSLDDPVEPGEEVSIG